MIEGISGWLPIIGTVSPLGFALVIFLMVYRGLLIPRSTVEFLAQERDQRLKEIAKDRDDWREAYHKREANEMRSRQQMETLIENSKVTIEVVQALKRGAV